MSSWKVSRTEISEEAWPPTPACTTCHNDDGSEWTEHLNMTSHRTFDLGFTVSLALHKFLGFIYG